MIHRFFSNIPVAIWGVVLALFLSDMSIYMVESILPVYIRSLGAPTFFIGFVEGACLFAVCLSQFISGYKSDQARSRKRVALFGVTFSTFSRFLFIFASTYPAVFCVKFFDRINQGIFKAPSDALIGDLSNPRVRGSSYGVKEMLSKAGSILGALLTSLILFLTMNNYRAVFIFALVPGIISALVFFFFVKDSPLSEAKTKRPLNWSVLKRFPRAYWDVIITTFIMKLSHFGNGLLLVRGNELGISSAFIPLLIVIIYFVTFCTAYPVGLLCDRFDQKKVYIWGLFFMCCSHFLLGWSSHIGGYIGGIIFWGAYQGVIQTSLSSMISRVSPKNLRGTGFGIFRLTIGLGTLMSNVVAGTLWDFFGATFSFVSAGLFIFVFATALFTRSLRGPFSLFVLRYSSKK